MGNHISGWDVSNVTDMGGMFMYASGNCDLTIWNVCKVVDYGNFADDGSALRRRVWLQQHCR